MPLVHISQKGDYLRTYARLIAKKLPGVIAEALNTKEGGVVSDTSVKVFVNETGLMDQNTGDILIHVKAHHFSERIQNSQHIAQAIKAGAEKALTGKNHPAVITVILELTHLDYA